MEHQLNKKFVKIKNIEAAEVIVRKKTVTSAFF